MSATQFKNDLTKPGIGEEPRSSTNAGMNVALILTVLLSLAFVIWAMAMSHGKNYGQFSPAQQHASQEGAPLRTPHTTYFNSKAIKSDNDKSYVDGQQLQAPPPGPNAP